MSLHGISVPHPSVDIILLVTSHCQQPGNSILPGSKPGPRSQGSYGPTGLIGQNIPVPSQNGFLPSSQPSNIYPPYKQGNTLHPISYNKKTIIPLPIKVKTDVVTQNIVLLQVS